MSILKFVMKGKAGKKKKKLTREEMNERIQQNLKVFGIQQFRKHQREIILSLIQGNDCFVIFPTGYGKSLLYQLPAMCLDGVAIIISPLISLMVDQVNSLKSKGIKARTWNSQVRITELRELKGDLMSIRPRTKILFTTPESLLSVNMKTPLTLLNRRKLISLFAIDEAHCISQWGFDFRPKYRSSLASIKLKYPTVPVIALTATATNAVKKDVLETLNLRNPKLFVSSFNRPEIRYEIRYKSLTPNGHLWDIVRFIRNERPNDFGIIYCRTIRRVEELSEYLTSQGIAQVEMYHGRLTRKIRNEISGRWKDGHVKVLVATIAFGMGVDKADIRYVIHESVPQSIEAFYQESGRAGRDRQRSHSLLYYSTSDKDDINYLINNDKRTNSMRKGVLRSKFADICKICETACCRRRMIVEYFGDRSNVQCNRTCDHCVNPNGVLDSIRRAVMTVSRKVSWRSQNSSNGNSRSDDDWSRELSVVYDRNSNSQFDDDDDDDGDLLTPLTRRRTRTRRRRRFEDPEVSEIRRRVTVQNRTKNVNITDDQSLDTILDNLEKDEEKKKKSHSNDNITSSRNRFIPPPPPPQRRRGNGKGAAVSGKKGGGIIKNKKKHNPFIVKKKRSTSSILSRRKVEVGGGGRKKMKKKRKRVVMGSDQRRFQSVFVSARALVKMEDNDELSRIKKKRKLE